MTDELALERERHREVGRRHRLAGAALRPEHGDHRPLGRGRAGATAPRQSLLEREPELARRLRQRHEVVRAGLERPLEKAVRRTVVQHDDGPVGPLGVRGADHLERLLVRLGAADDDEIRALLDLAAGAADVRQLHRSERRAGRQSLSDCLQTEVRLQCRVDVEAPAVHGRPPTERRICTGGTPRSIVSTVTIPGRDALAPALRPQGEPQLAVVGRERDLRSFDVVDTETHVRRALALLTEGQDRDVCKDPPEHRAGLPTVDRPAAGVERDHVEARVHVHAITDLDPVDQPVRGVERHRDDTLLVSQLGGERVTRRDEVGGRELGALEDLARRDLVPERGGVAQRPVQHLALADRRDRVQILLGDDVACGSLRDRVLRDENRHHGTLCLEAVAVAVQVEQDRRAGEQGDQERRDQRPPPRRHELGCELHWSLLLRLPSAS